MVLQGAVTGFAYGSLALATLGCIIFSLVKWDRQSSDKVLKKNDTEDSAVA